MGSLLSLEELQHPEAGDGRRPSGEIGALFESAELFPHCDAGFLKQVLGVGQIPHQREDVRKDLSLVSAQERLEGDTIISSLGCHWLWQSEQQYAAKHKMLH
jgi:hypothetical protein